MRMEVERTDDSTEMQRGDQFLEMTQPADSWLVGSAVWLQWGEAPTMSASGQR